MSFVDRVAVVTGAAQGIGLAISTALLKEGCKVCVSDINEKLGRETVHKLNEDFGSGRAIFVSCDTTSEQQYEALLKKTLEEFGEVHILVNNAGILLEQDYRKCVEVNLIGPIIGCQTALKFMGKSNGGKGGAVVNTASIAGLVSHPVIPVYIATKHGVVGLTRSYGHPYHMAKDGVSFAAICPTYTRTHLLEDFKSNTLHSADITNRTDIVEPEFVAEGVVKLLKEGRNGATLLITKDRGHEYIELQDDLKSICIT